MVRHLATIVLVAGLTCAAHATAGQPRVFAAPEVTPSHPDYIPAYNGTSAQETPRTPQAHLGELMLPVLLLLGLLLYLAPIIIACKRAHPNAVPIIIINLFLGWTLLGWVIALAWSASAIAPQRA